MSARTCGAMLQRARGEIGPTCDRQPGHDAEHRGEFMGMVVSWYHLESVTEQRLTIEKTTPPYPADTTEAEVELGGEVHWLSPRSITDSEPTL